MAADTLGLRPLATCDDAAGSRKCELAPLGLAERWEARRFLLRPGHHPVQEFIYRDVIFRARTPAADRNSGCVDTLPIARYQWMPPIEIAPFIDQTIGAGRREPG